MATFATEEIAPPLKKNRPLKRSGSTVRPVSVTKHCVKGEIDLPGVLGSVKNRGLTTDQEIANTLRDQPATRVLRILLK